MKLSSEQITQFQNRIFTWYTKNKRDLPWRRTRDPYAILISEVMLQQTQVQRVIPKYEAWLEVLPTIESLAKATTTDVLKLWSGLGYNRRALFLQKTAKVIGEEYHGIFPAERERLKRLPGIGMYTASAIACFAFDEQIAVVDTNVRKVILIEVLHGVKKATEKEIEYIAQKLLPHGKACEWNQALMDYASHELAAYKISIPKQSHFLTSDRYFRGQTIKQLLDRQSLSFDELHLFFHQRGRNIERERLERIVVQLAKEGFLQYADNRLSITL